MQRTSATTARLSVPPGAGAGAASSVVGVSTSSGATSKGLPTSPERTSMGFCSLLASLKPIGASQALDVSVSDDGAFELRFGGSAWFRGGDVKVRSDGAAYSLAEKTLKHVHTTRTTGADGFGASRPRP
ncbi:hypothetical protein JL721_7541 [Aureococcus anophagefferens]|nr:hypothetical protein JL721_7541 [Aureococcus anophagefferens]